MGLGIVLFGWELFCSCASIPFAIGLGVWSWRWSERKGWRSRLRALAAALIPYAAILVALIWFFFYAWYSEAVRGVDPGLGDSWVTPIGHDYFFCMIDSTDDGYLMRGGCSGVAEVDYITQLARVGDFVVGVHENNRAFVFDLTSDKLTQYKTIDEALAQFSPPPDLQTPNDFYSQYRFDWRDKAFQLALLGAELATIVMGYRLFIRRPRNHLANTDAVAPQISQEGENEL